MDVDVCEAITKEVVEEGDVQKAALDPVALGVAEDEVQSGHEEDVEGDKEKKRVVAAWTEGVGKEDEDEKATDDLEENTEEEDDPVEESCKIFVQGATFQGGVVGGEAPGKTENGGDDGDGLVRLEDRQLPLHAHLDQPDLDLVLRHVVDQAWQQEVELDSRLKGGLETHLHDSGGGVEHLKSRIVDFDRIFRVDHLACLKLLLPCHPLWSLGKVVLAIVVVLDEEHREGPEHDAAEESDGVENESEVAFDQADHPGTTGHVLL